ncbi:MAG: xanthan lyase [Bacteroidales bacterium]|nr:xanthan lyase [Bacteroidales bacterium]
MKRLFAVSLLFILFLTSNAQTSIVKDFKPACDSLRNLMIEKTSVRGGLKIKSILKRDGKLDFYFDESLGDFPFRRGDAQWFRNNLQCLFPSKYSSFKVGKVYTKNVDISTIEVASLSFKGSSFKSHNRTQQPQNREDFVKGYKAQEYSKGLSGRNIALWQSHGYIYDSGARRWNWQRPCLFQTVEDMYTQSYVLPFLVPMLENAGAYIMMPRERDIQTNEVIADNDECLGGRGSAVYEETGRWKDVGDGFADIQETYLNFESPFGMGTARRAECTRPDSKDKHATALWRPDIPERGHYSVYISYKSLHNSTRAAHYQVNHMGGTSEFIVNQQLGGGTWVYLGTFEFDKGSEGYVTLSSMTPDGYEHEKGAIVTADAVRFGGGMGNIARAPEGSEDDAEISGMPRSVEGARYWLQYSGVDQSIYNASEEDNDYTDDYMCRGDWVNWISGGSCMNPKAEGLGIPVDLTLGFHSDAGVTPDDSIIGTLTIYTYESEGKFELPSGESRMTSREFADVVQTQIVHDIRKQYNPEWSRRQIRNRGYRESRTPSSPSMLLEILSHQNFGDMKYGLDPAFRFSVSRAVYKGMLKYLSNRYGIPYTVQPLPVTHMKVEFAKNSEARISWQDRVDELEPTAVPTGYILYTRIDDGAFDTGKIIEAAENGKTLSYNVEIEDGHIYSFKVEAFNDGGKSFPSETVCIGRPDSKRNQKNNVLIVNNFDRVSGPAFFDTPEYAGFDNSLDSGVPFIRDISFIGEMYMNHRNEEWQTNDNPGFGGSHQHYAGKTVAGNTFDFAYVHGKAIMKAGYPFCTSSNEAFCKETDFDAWCVDMICGKEVSTVIGSADNPVRYTVFTEDMQEAITAFTSEGGHILISGANIATDIWGGVYQYDKDEEFKKASIKFAEEILGYRLVSGHGSRTGEVYYTNCERFNTSKGESITFHNSINEKCYSVESPDGISPRGKASTFLKYSDTDIPAGICKEGKGYKSVCLGFPIETLKEESQIERIISLTLEYFNR